MVINRSCDSFLITISTQHNLKKKKLYNSVPFILHSNEMITKGNCMRMKSFKLIRNIVRSCVLMNKVTQQLRYSICMLFLLGVIYNTYDNFSSWVGHVLARKNVLLVWNFYFVLLYKPEALSHWSKWPLAHPVEVLVHFRRHEIKR